MSTLYVVTCNGLRYTQPLTKDAAEKYAQMRRDDRKDLRRTGDARDRTDNMTYGSQQKWEVMPV